jgi:hypothetical protein
MIVVHSAEISILYPRVVISSLARRLENLHFTTIYISFGVQPRDHYMPLQMFTLGNMSHFAKVSPTEAPLAMLRFPHRDPSCTTRFTGTPCTLPRTTEQGTFPEAILISKQVVPYQTRGGTCCHRGLLLKTGP